MIIYKAIVMITTLTTAPLIPNIILRNNTDLEPSLNIVNIVVSSVNIDTQAAAKLIDFPADKIGLLYFLYLIESMIAIVSDVNVYVAIAIVMIMSCSNVQS